MPAISGKNGSVTKGGAAIADVRSWSHEPVCELLSYNSSSTGGNTARVPGNKDSTSVVEVYCTDGVVPDIVEGEEYTFELIVSDTGTKYTGLGVVASAPVECSIEDGALVGASFNIEQNGAWVKS